MGEQQLLDRLCLEMLAFNCGDPQREQHFIKVHRFAQLIGRMEKLDPHLQFVLEAAALVHDIGIRPAEEKYGSSNGKLQEQEGPAYAATLLQKLGFAPQDIERICYLVAHHHTYGEIDGLDYQILVEADFLVNFYEDEIGEEGILKAQQQIFRTKTGRALCGMIYGPRRPIHLNPD